MATAPQTVRFTNPPVTEVALSVAFEPIPRLQPVHLGAWWQTIKAPYVNVEQHPPLPAQLDQFPGDMPTAAISMPFPFPFENQFPRYWFVTEGKDRVLQIQQDRFVTNWRKKSDDEKYPEYHRTLRPEFELRWEQFCEFIRGQHLGQPRILQCEVSYVNALKQGQEWQSLSDISKVVAPWGGSFSGELPPLEGAVIHAGFLIPDTKGRVHLTFQPAIDISGRSILQITVFARVRPDNSETAAVLRWLDLSHDWAVHAFAAFTTEEMHGLWNRQG